MGLTGCIIFYIELCKNKIQWKKENKETKTSVKANQAKQALV